MTLDNSSAGPASADPDNVFDGPAIIEIVRRFGDRTELTTNLMPGPAGPDWLQVLNEPGWTSDEKVLLTVVAALHTGSRVFRLRSPRCSISTAGT